MKSKGALRFVVWSDLPALVAGPASLQFPPVLPAHRSTASGFRAVHLFAWARHVVCTLGDVLSLRGCAVLFFSWGLD